MNYDNRKPVGDNMGRFMSTDRKPPKPTVFKPMNKSGTYKPSGTDNRGPKTKQ